MGEHLVSGREARHLFANGDDDAGRLDPEHQGGWRPRSQPPPRTISSQLANSGRPQRDHDLVQSDRLRRRQLEHLHLAPEILGAGGAHQSPVSRPAMSLSWLLMPSRLRVAA
jgi:hypothetical protein